MISQGHYVVIHLNYRVQTSILQFYMDANVKRKNAILAFNAYRQEMYTFNPQTCDVRYSKNEKVQRLNSAFIIRRDEFHKTDNGPIKAGDSTGIPLESTISRTSDPDGINLFSDYHLLRAVWFLKYATATQCLQFLKATKRREPQLFISETIDKTYTRKRLKELADQGFLITYKIDDSTGVRDEGHKDRQTANAYSLTEEGTSFLNETSGLHYKRYPYKYNASPEVILGRLSENEVIKKICDSPNFAAFNRPHLFHRSFDLEALTGDDTIDIDYSIELLNPDDSKQKTSLMVQFVRDPNWGSAIDTKEDVTFRHESLAPLSRSFLLKKAGKDGRRGNAKVLFVCPTKAALDKILADLREMKDGTYFTSNWENYIFTSEKAVALVAQNGGTIQDALFSVKKDFDEKTMKLIWTVATPPNVF